jgi:hypothetical protein
MISQALNRAKAIVSTCEMREQKLSEQGSANKRGLASASNETRERVARAGGEAPHEKRGLQAADTETRQTVARKGGLARGEQRRKARQQRESGPNDPS